MHVSVHSIRVRYYGAGICNERISLSERSSYITFIFAVYNSSCLKSPQSIYTSVIFHVFPLTTDYLIVLCIHLVKQYKFLSCAEDSL